LSTSSNLGFVHLAPQVPAVIPTPQPGGVLLNWAGTGAGDGFRVMRSGDGTNYTQIASLVSGATAYLDGNLPEATPFAYKVIAFAGSETAASDVVVTNTRLRTATAFSGTQVGADRVDFTWSDNSSAETGYVVYADAGGFWMFDPTVLPANTTSYSWNGLELGTAYDFYVIAVGPGFSGDDLGSLAPTVNSLPSAKWSMTTPSGPNMLEAQPTGPTSMGLHWQDSSSTETGFQIERSTDGTTWATVGTAAANATAYADTGLTPGTAYYYRVRETGSAYASFPSAAVTWLNVPTGLTAQAISNHRVQLNWSAAPGQQDEFYVEFSTDGLNWLGLGTVSGSVYAYTVSAQPDGSPLQAGQTYYFRIGRARLDATWGRTASEPTVAVSVAAT
jgi:titin